MLQVSTVSSNIFFISSSLAIFLGLTKSIVDSPTSFTFLIVLFAFSIIANGSGTTRELKPAPSQMFHSFVLEHVMDSSQKENFNTSSTKPNRLSPRSIAPTIACTACSAC